VLLIAGLLSCFFQGRRQRRVMQTASQVDRLSPRIRTPLDASAVQKNRVSSPMRTGASLMLYPFTRLAASRVALQGGARGTATSLTFPSFTVTSNSGSPAHRLVKGDAELNR
jgi:hypothetical protein